MLLFSIIVCCMCLVKGRITHLGYHLLGNHILSGEREVGGAGAQERVFVRRGLLGPWEGQEEERREEEEDEKQ